MSRKKSARRPLKAQRGGDTPNENSIGAPPHLICQCPGCPNDAAHGSEFCNHHTEKGCPIKSPLTGSEPEYNPDEYNGDKSKQHSHNCFAYALRVSDNEKIAECRKSGNCKFHVPGKSKGHPGFSGQMGKTCSDVIGRTMADVPNGYVIDFATPCKKGFSKIAAVVDKDRDFHYYSQDKNGYWSHKPGGRAVTNKDAVGSPIYDPQRASRYYPKEDPNDSGLNYSSFCSYMCVPREQPIQVAGARQRRDNGARSRKRRHRA
jgi:hypothetical protein